MEETAGVVKLITGGYYCGMTAFEVSAMNQIPLADLVAEKGQTHVARALGVSPPAISKALSAERIILVTIHDNGAYEAQELRPFPAQARKNAVA